MTALVNLIVMLGMIVVIPMGLTLIDGPGLTTLRRLWPLAAAAGRDHPAPPSDIPLVSRANGPHLTTHAFGPDS
ncbi:hypothetical protein QMK19_15975 [Streptomyces sp. H10-C2]|uniref:hypothetical protein n=1 Tax=unclassified Streptomyces TaxID=2593676 RepID=UPI0024BA7AB7|nr:MULTISPECIES: hypothetical protein [unclassified Streptomyces]MDJ0346193.1 hypothetical protein [Streptomyces sp. PH10-H1]MDJ0371144.1 hypothetical protein [Streptomyces sp. H10-C2]